MLEPIFTLSSKKRKKKEKGEKGRALMHTSPLLIEGMRDFRNVSPIILTFL